MLECQRCSDAELVLDQSLVTLPCMTTPITTMVMIIIMMTMIIMVILIFYRDSS